MENNFRTVTEEEWNTHIEDKAQLVKEYYIHQMKKGKPELDILKNLMEIELRPSFIRENSLENCLETNLCIRVQIHHTVFLDGLEQRRLEKSKLRLGSPRVGKRDNYLQDMFHE